MEVLRRLLLPCAAICTQGAGLVVFLLDDGNVQCSSGELDPEKMNPSDLGCQYTFNLHILSQVEGKNKNASHQYPMKGGEGVGNGPGKKYGLLYIRIKPTDQKQEKNSRNSEQNKEGSKLKSTMLKEELNTKSTQRSRPEEKTLQGSKPGMLMDTSSSPLLTSSVKPTESKQDKMAPHVSSLTMNKSPEKQSGYFIFFSSKSPQLAILRFGDKAPCEQSSLESLPTYKIRKAESALKSLSEAMVLGFRDQVIVCGGITTSEKDDTPTISKLCFQCIMGRKNLRPIKGMTYERAGGVGFVNDKGFSFIGGKTSLADDLDERFRYSNVIEVFQGKAFTPKKSPLPKLTTSICIATRTDQPGGFLIYGNVEQSSITLSEFDKKALTFGSSWPSIKSYLTFSCSLYYHSLNEEQMEAVLVSGIQEGNRIFSMLFDPRSKKWVQLHNGPLSPTHKAAAGNMQLLGYGLKVYLIFEGVSGVWEYEPQHGNYSNFNVGPVVNRIDLGVSNVAMISTKLGDSKCTSNGPTR